jgi:hypothetical protein
MLKFYFSGARDPTKVALFLEETGLQTIRFRSIPSCTYRKPKTAVDRLRIGR